MSAVYSLSTTVEITFVLPKLYLTNRQKAIQLIKLRLLFYVKNRAAFHLFKLSFPKILSKSFLLSIITCRHLSWTYHSQKYFIKTFYYLAKTWLCVTYLHLSFHLSFPKAYSKCVLLC